MAVKGIGTRDGHISRFALQVHLWMHMVPLALSLVLLMAWRPLCGALPGARDIVVGLVALCVLCVAYLATPLASGAKGRAKLAEVYRVDSPEMLAGVGGGIVTMSAVLLGVFGRSWTVAKG